MESSNELNPTSLSMDLSGRYTLWSLLLHMAISLTCLYGCSQIQVQRLLTLRNIKRSKLAIWWSIPLLLSFHVLCCVCGLVIYANFESCDPLTSPAKPVHSADQLLPFYVTSTMNKYPGLPGFCISGIFSASLSTISSAINSMAAVTWEDLIRPRWPNLKHSVTITKVLSFFYGMLCIALSFAGSSLGNLPKTGIVITGTFLAPTLGVYVLAAFTKNANEKGAISGIVAGLAVAFCLIFLSAPEKYHQLPLSNECPALSTVPYYSKSPYKVKNLESIDYFQNSTLSSMYSTTESTVRDQVNKFSVSFMWISSISLVTCLIVGYVVSLITGYFGGNLKEVVPEYLSPIRRRFCRTNKRSGFADKKKKDEIPL